MFRKIKKCLTAFITAAVLSVTAVGCTMGTSTAEVITVGDFQLKAGVYIYYQNSALEEAKNLAKQDNSELDTSDTDALEECVIEEKKFLDWVYDKTIINCAEHISVIQKFDEMGLTLAQDDIDMINEYVDSVMVEDKQYRENGIGEESLKEILLNTYKATEIFDAIYGEGGSENVQESTLKESYIQNNVRVKYVALDLHDNEGNDLDEAGKTEIKNLANTYLNKVKGVSGNDKMLEKFNEISDEYDAYIAEQDAEAETEETTEAVTTAAEETTETTTTTTTDPYANETIIAAVTTDEETSEDELTYTPSKKFYDWAYNTSTKLNTPEIIEDEDKIYVAVKLDIEERMTEDDLWAETTVENVRFNMFSDAMQEDIDEWVAALDLKLNQDAIDRYEPFDYEVEETTAYNMVGY